MAVLSGDHIYKMDYSKDARYHKEKGAACTIAMLEVPWEEASRFGLMITDEDNAIKEFEEKPKKVPEATRLPWAFTYSRGQMLRKYLIDDENNPESSNDFGHDVIPAMHSPGEKLYAYLFDGYWKDVGTIDSLWEATLTF